MNASNSQSEEATSMAVVHIGCLQTGWWPEVGLVAGEWTVFCPSGGGGERALGTYLMEDGSGFHGLLSPHLVHIQGT